jgi:hypothetical protein
MVTFVATKINAGRRLCLLHWSKGTYNLGIRVIFSNLLKWCVVLRENNASLDKSYFTHYWCFRLL